MDDISSEYVTLTPPDGLPLCVRRAGRPEGRPIVFIHGFSQCHLAWTRQFESALRDEFRLVAYDLRGHGWSGKPSERDAYKESRRWADDLATVLASLDGAPATLVAWSYGGRVVCDYLAAYGTAGIAGINFVAGVISNDESHFGRNIGFVRATADADPSASLAGIREFVRASFATEPARDDLETMIAYNAMLPPHIRRYVLGRPVDARDLLAALNAPVLFSHGTGDRIIDPSMSAFGASLVPGSRISTYDKVGHATFYEAAPRFNRELAEFTRSADGPVGGV